MWIYANGGEDELGSDGAVGARGEECAIGTGGACTRLEAGAADIVMWGPLSRDCWRHLDLWGIYLRIYLSKRICEKRRGPRHKLPLLNGECGLANPTTHLMGLSRKT